MAKLPKRPDSPWADVGQVDDDVNVLQGRAFPRVIPVRNDEIRYEVVIGDTLPVVAGKVYNGDQFLWPIIADRNNIDDGTDIAVGSVLFCPSRNTIQLEVLG